MAMDTETPENTIDTSVKRWLMRVGGGMLAVGGAIALLAACIGGVEMSRTGVYSSLVGSARTTGGAVLVAGLVLLLLAQRIPRLLQAWRQANAGPTSPRVAGQTNVAGAAIVAAVAVAGVTLTLWILPFAVPGIFTFLVTYIFLLFLPVVLITTCVYGRGWLRTFCIGALLPASIATIGMGLFTNVLLQTMFRRYGDRFDALVEFGEGNMSAAIVWTSCLCLGAVSMATRFIVEIIAPPLRATGDTDA